MTPRARPAGGDRACASCEAPLASDQRWCLECGARRTGADPVALLFAPGGPLAGTADAGPAHAGASDAGHAAAAGAPYAAAPTRRARPPRASQLERRRRAAAPLACAALVGLFVVTGGAKASLNQPGQPPFTVVLPQFAQPAPVAVEEPADEAFADADVPLDESLPADEVVEEPAAEEPASDEPSDDGDDDDGPTEEAPASSSPIKHVFLIVLASTDVGALAADEQAAPYLGGTLAKSGTLLTGYRAVARGALANRIALVSGQGPTAQTLTDCTAFADVVPADPLDGGQTGGDGCVYGYETGTLADQLNGAGKSWRAYLEPAAGAARTSAPTARVAAACTPAAEASRRNPFAWFRGLAEADDCDERNVPLSRLAADLEDPDATPALSFIASDAQLGSADADAFLERVVPQIQNSLAYANGGLIVITSDQPPAPEPAPAPTPPAADPPVAPPSTETTPQPPADTTPTTTTPAPPTATTPQPPTATHPAPLARTAAAEEQPWPATYPNVGDAAAAGAGAPVGALLISPFTQAGRRDDTPASHFTLLRTLATIYGVDPLGYAAAENVAPLPDALFEAQQ